MADAVGDIIRGHPFLVIKGLSKTDETIALGDVVAYDTDGWAQCTASLYGPFGMAMNATTGSGQQEVSVLIQGACRVLKITGTAIPQGTGVMPSATSGAVTLWAVADAGATPDQASINASILDACQCIGTCLEDVASGPLLADVYIHN